jgi:hypothetical protein
MRQKIVFAWLAVLLLLVVVGVVALGAQNREPTEGYIERYLYEAVPLTGDVEKKKEAIRAEYLFCGPGVKYRSRVVSSAFTEVVTINMGKGGEFIDGTRVFTAGKDVTEQRIFIEGDTGQVEQIKTGRMKATAFPIPRDKRLAADGSLLMLLRSFPFNSVTEWIVFIVDFSGETVTLTVRQAGRERIVVQAGEFECIRMEVVVHIPVIGPTLTYWIAADEPHFLVKNIGRRGPFTPNYVTTLTGREYENCVQRSQLRVK